MKLGVCKDGGRSGRSLKKDEYDQNLLYEKNKELIKYYFKIKHVQHP